MLCDSIGFASAMVALRSQLEMTTLKRELCQLVLEVSMKERLRGFIVSGLSHEYKFPAFGSLNDKRLRTKPFR